MSALVVLGDVMLDVDVHAEAHRLAPDGAAPVLEQRRREERAGGAALAAALAAAACRPSHGGMGDHSREVVLVCPLADDAAAQKIAALLDPRVRLLAVPARGSTPVKTRLLCGGRTVARVDEGDARLEVDEPPAAVVAALRDADAVLVSDYGTGTTHSARLRELVSAVGVPVIWDPHPRGADPVRGCALVTPNHAETGVSSADAPVQEVAGRASELVRTWSARNVAVTLGRRGALLADDAGRSSYFPASAVTSADPCGAGDCFAAAAAVALGSGATPEEAVGQAVHRATGFVAAGGVTHHGARPAGTDNGADIVSRVRAAGGTVVATGGCFDLLHAGHVATLDAARALGDCLVVCLNSDASVRRLKGSGRPLQSAADRARVLGALRAVDQVVVFDEDTPHAVLTQVRPDIWVKGGDYRAGDLPEARLVRSWGGEVLTVPYLSGRSTSTLVELSRR